MDYGVVITVQSLPIATPMGTSYLVLPDYTNEVMDAQLVGRTDPWARAMNALRSTPADWRQSLWAAAYASCQRGQGLPDLNDAILAHVERFHAGERPSRIETPCTAP